MGAPVFVVDTDALAQDRVLLAGDEGRHAAVVRRLRVGEQVHLTDGVGRVARCMVAEVDGARLVCAVQDRYAEAAPTPRLVVVQALPKGERADLAVELLTEVGVDVVVPWPAARCVTRWRGERTAKAVARWRAHAREAGKQSRRAWLPEVRDPATTDEVAGLLGSAALPVVLHEEAEVPVTALGVPQHGDVVVVVGPEGGISGEELAAFGSAGARPVRLGPTVLRTSTAGAVAAGVLLSRTDRWA